MPSRYGFDTLEDRRREREERDRKYQALRIAEAIKPTVCDILADYGEANGWGRKVFKFEGSFKLTSVRSWMIGGVEVAVNAADEQPSLMVVFFPGGAPHAKNEQRLCAVLREMTGLPVTRYRFVMQPVPD